MFPDDLQELFLTDMQRNFRLHWKISASIPGTACLGNFLTKHRINQQAIHAGLVPQVMRLMLEKIVVSPLSLLPCAYDKLHRAVKISKMVCLLHRASAASKRGHLNI